MSAPKSVSLPVTIQSIKADRGGGQALVLRFPGSKETLALTVPGPEMPDDFAAGDECFIQIRKGRG